MPPQRNPQDPALLDGASSRFANAFLRRSTQHPEGRGSGPRPWTWILGAVGVTAVVLAVVFAVSRIPSGSDHKTDASAKVSASPTASRATPSTISPEPGHTERGRTLSSGGTDPGGTGTSGGTGAAPTPGTSTAPSPTGTNSGSGAARSGSTRVEDQPVDYPGVTVVGHASGRCVSAAGHRSSAATDGTRLEIDDCDGGSWQKIDFRSDGTARIYGLCMDIAGASEQEGTPIQLVGCNGGWAQKFELNSSYDLVDTVAGMCVDVVDGKTANGTALQLWDCAGTSNQKWSKD
ncbi:Ricin-type beta-trefoil lectin domain-containing protein [Actinacidiphila yanglinensis]|uniref:Ricin-type beta-trefoil lectin domain-containing protein n=1 Tax=Actinacidiphila yanglinensis TaxID=310779 RepID=A0A1H6DZB2_9ACTN|nr:RICIN domain-containing protein [Actinacidiphila yanglinensis]SEG90521.1 Ricin-type beta-trefoil lectin domain-containing protein [Actinacidiphila yanglinensis]